MGFTGLETKNIIYQDYEDYGLVNTGESNYHYIGRLSDGTWIAAYVKYDTATFRNIPQVVSSTDGVNWTSMSIPNINTESYSTIDLTIDTDDSIHVTVCNQYNLKVIYYYLYNGSWTSTTITSTTNIGQNHIEVDSSNKPHIVTYDGGANIKYCNKIGASWSAWENVANILGYAFISFDISPTDVLHFALYDMNNYIYYSYGTSGSWSVPTAVYESSVNNADIICNQDKPTIAIGEFQNCKVFELDGTWSNIHTFNWEGRSINWENESINRIFMKALDGNVYVAFESSEFIYTNHQIYCMDNKSGTWIDAVNITRDDGIFWSSSTLWVDADKMGLFSSGDMVECALWFADQNPPEPVSPAHNVVYYNVPPTADYTEDTTPNMIYNDSAIIYNFYDNTIYVNGYYYTAFAYILDTNTWEIYVYKSSDGITWVDTGYPIVDDTTSTTYNEGWKPTIAADSSGNIHLVYMPRNSEN
jgi:hypothetical protein